MESVCHGYVCIPLYVNIIWCSGFPEIYMNEWSLPWELGFVESMSVIRGICAFFYM